MLKKSKIRNEFIDYSLLVTTIIGIILSIELTVFYFMTNSPLGGLGFCSTNSYITCDALIQSPSSAFFGVPFSVFNLVYYLVILPYSLALFFNLPIVKKDENPKVYIFTFATFALLISTPFFLFSMSKGFCLLCFASYVANLLLFVLTKKGISLKNHYKNLFDCASEKIKNNKFAKVGLFILILIPVIFFIIDSTGLLKPKQMAQPMPQPMAPQMSMHEYYGINGKKLKVGNIGNILGSKNPKVTVYEYTDFQCPYCQLSNQQMQQLVQDEPYVQVIHKDLPLNQACNNNMNGSMHENACTASLYSRAAEKQGKFWDLNILMFNNQKDLSEKNILKLAKSLNLNVDKLKKDAHDPNALEQLKSDTKKIVDSGITATPTITIEKDRFNGLITYKKLREEVKKHKKS